MCGVCGCGESEVRIDGKAGHPSRTGHGHNHHHHDDNTTGWGPSEGDSRSRMIRIEQDILTKNDGYTAANRARLSKLGVFALALVSSPGAGKTTLLTATVTRLGELMSMVVIEKAIRRPQMTLSASGADGNASCPDQHRARGCHLDVHIVGHALDQLDIPANGVLFIENVGNLVCPAAFDLGEHHKVAIFSSTRTCSQQVSLMVLNKTDLLPYVNFDVANCVEYALRVNREPRDRGTAAVGQNGRGHGGLDRLDNGRTRGLTTRSDCDAVKTPHGRYNFRCPTCGMPTPKVVTGREMQVAAIELDFEESHVDANQH